MRRQQSRLPVDLERVLVTPFREGGQQTGENVVWVEKPFALAIRNRLRKHLKGKDADRFARKLAEELSDEIGAEVHPASLLLFLELSLDELLRFVSKHSTDPRWPAALAALSTKRRRGIVRSLQPDPRATRSQEFFTYQEIAQIWGYSVPHVKRVMIGRHGPGTKGRTRTFSRAEVEAAFGLPA